MLTRTQAAEIALQLDAPQAFRRQTSSFWHLLKRLRESPAKINDTIHHFLSFFHFSFCLVARSAISRSFRWGTVLFHPPLTWTHYDHARCISRSRTIFGNYLKFVFCQLVTCLTRLCRLSNKTFVYLFTCVIYLFWSDWAYLFYKLKRMKDYPQLKYSSTRLACRVLFKSQQTELAYGNDTCLALLFLMCWKKVSGLKEYFQGTRGSTHVLGRCCVTFLWKPLFFAFTSWSISWQGITSTRVNLQYSVAAMLCLHCLTSFDISGKLLLRAKPHSV